MRASTRRGITIALVGLLVIVLIGWFVQEAAASGAARAPDRVTTQPAAPLVTESLVTAPGMTVPGMTAPGMTVPSPEPLPNPDRWTPNPDR